MHIMRAEVPGPVVGKLVPRARDTAKILYIIYASLTVAETIFLMFGGMNFFEALLHAFATAGTGGFSTRNNSIASFNSSYIEMVIASFLVLYGMNFNLYYLIITGKLKAALKSEELHCYILLILGTVTAFSLGIYNIYGSIGTTLKNAFFNVMTILSTAGFCTVDFTTWPQYTQAMIVVLMFIGGCAGSTGGGMKLSRVMLLVKNAGADVRRMVSPRHVKRVRMDGKCVPDNVLTTVSTFFFLYLAMSLVTIVVYAMDKRKAVKSQWRIPEATLHLCELLCGWPGAMIAQVLIRHKNAKLSFQLVFWAMTIVNVGIFAFIVFK